MFSIFSGFSLEMILHIISAFWKSCLQNHHIDIYVEAFTVFQNYSIFDKRYSWIRASFDKIFHFYLFCGLFTSNNFSQLQMIGTNFIGIIKAFVSILSSVTVRRDLCAIHNRFISIRAKAIKGFRKFSMPNERKQCN